MLLDLVHPVLDCAEGLAVSNVVGNNDTVSALVVAGCDGLEALLACCVPNLKFDCLAVNLVITDFKVDANGWHEIVTEGIILYKEARLSFALGFRTTSGKLLSLYP